MSYLVKTLIEIRAEKAKLGKQPSKLILGEFMLSELAKSMNHTPLIIIPGHKFLGLTIELNESDIYYLDIV